MRFRNHYLCSSTGFTSEQIFKVTAGDYKAMKRLKFRTKMIVAADCKAVKGLKFRLK